MKSLNIEQDIPFQVSNCPNCGNELPDSVRFCPACGQSAHTQRLDMHHILHDLVHVFTHADKGFLYLTKELALRPGITAKAYMHGKRKQYFNPFSYLVLTVAVSAFLTNYIHLLEMDAHNSNPVSAMISKNINLVFLIAVPITAVINKLLFYKSGYNLAEHLALQAFMGGFRVFFFILIFTPLVIFYRAHYFSVLSIYMAAWAAFLCWTNIQFFGGNKLWVIIRTFLGLVLTQIVITLLIFAAITMMR
jgi:hypothetical protein